MRAVVVERPGGPEVMRMVEVPDPLPGPGQLRVRVAAAGVNFIDVYHRSGLYPRETPFVLGQEGAGRVEMVGPGVTSFAPGDRVAWATGSAGSYADVTTVAAGSAVAVPDDVDDRTAAALMLQGLTAHYLVGSTFPVRPGQTVLVHAGAGGVGLLLTQLAVHRGARVITTVGDQQKARLSWGAGASEVVLYRREDVAARVRELTDGVGVPVVYDGVGAATFEASLACLSRRGTLVSYGNASGAVPPVDVLTLMRHGSCYLTRPTLADYIATREELTSRAGDMFTAAARWLSVRVGDTWLLSRAADAHRALEGRQTTGKVLLLP